MFLYFNVLLNILNNNLLYYKKLTILYLHQN